MANFISRMLDVAHRFTAFDFAIFKLCLLSIGILLGTYFWDFFLRFLTEVWIIAVIALIYLLVQTFSNLPKKR